MFSDSVELVLSSGKGGAGSASFRREKHVSQGGPDGGDGGRGGDVFFKVDRNSHTLAKFRGLRELKAQNGEQGYGRKMYGKKGEFLEVVVPPGTQVIDVESGDILIDLIEEGQRVLFLEGGLGGLGNWHFRSSTNQRPTYAQPGRAGEKKLIRLELKLIADVGLVGFPNVGKSTLISTISNAKPEIANYEFTTLTPKLGVVEVDDFSSFVMADIPGIIEGASEGRGLGLEFLKHIERTKFLLFMIDITNQRSLKEQFETLKNELKQFSPELDKRRFAIALTKIDGILEIEAKEKISEFMKFLKQKKSSEPLFGIDETLPYFLQEQYDAKIKKPFFIIPISSVTHRNIKTVTYALNDILKKARNEEADCN